jgi:hypothetical protein
MQIKTIVRYDPASFDDYVNLALKEGYQLEHRGLMPPNKNGETLHYAQLVLPDPPAETEPEEFDPFQALYQVQQFCKDQERCHTCPIQDWCNQLQAGGDPTDWELPEVEA